MANEYTPYRLKGKYLQSGIQPSSLTKPFQLKVRYDPTAGVVTTYKAIGEGEFVAGAAISDDLSINLAKNGKITVGIALWSTSVTASNSLIKNLYFKLI